MQLAFEVATKTYKIAKKRLEYTEIREPRKIFYKEGNLVCLHTPQVKTGLKKKLSRLSGTIENSEEIVSSKCRIN